MDVFEEEVSFSKCTLLPDPRKGPGGPTVGWWILFGLRDMPQMWAGSCLTLHPRVDPPYNFGVSHNRELVYVDEGGLQIGPADFTVGEVVNIDPRTELVLRVSQELRTYALWQRLRRRGLSDSRIAEDIAGGLRKQVRMCESDDVSFRTFVRANTAFRRLMRELEGILLPFERSQL